MDKSSPLSKVVAKEPAASVSSARKNRLEALAYRINDWEDEALTASKQSTPEMRNKKATPSKYGASPTKSSPGTPSKSSPVGKREPGNAAVRNLASPKKAPKDLDSPIKAVVLEQSVLRTLVCLLVSA